MNMKKSLTKDLRERKSLDDILDLWLPSEDIYLSFNTFLEAIIYRGSIKFRICMYF